MSWIIPLLITLVLFCGAWWITRDPSSGETGFDLMMQMYIGAFVGSAFSWIIWGIYMLVRLLNSSE